VTNEPALQFESGAQTRFTDVEGATVSYSSKLHSRTGAQAAVPAVEVKLTPAMQTTHWRSVTLVGATDSPCPARQTVVFWQVRSAIGVKARVSNCQIAQTEAATQAGALTAS
jgi:hypothetical protein